MLQQSILYSQTRYPKSSASSSYRNLNSKGRRCLKWLLRSQGRTIRALARSKAVLSQRLPPQRTRFRLSKLQLRCNRLNRLGMRRNKAPSKINSVQQAWHQSRKRYTFLIRKNHPMRAIKTRRSSPNRALLAGLSVRKSSNSPASCLQAAKEPTLRSRGSLTANRVH